MPVTISQTLFSFYSPKQDVNRIIPKQFFNSIKNKKFDCSSGKQLRDFIYIDDVIEAIIKTLKNESVSKGKLLTLVLDIQ